MTGSLTFSIPMLAEDPEAPFPDPMDSLHPEGLIAVGGDLDPRRLINAYRNGLFPWYEPGGPILWWSPDPRAVLIPGHLHVSRRLARTFRQQRFRITVDQEFGAVVDGCAAPRSETSGTWITPEMKTAYLELHRLGTAHSLEVRRNDRLVGGLYGVSLGSMFFAESKFHAERDASKVALLALMHRLEEQGFLVCDCQLWNPHLERFGVRLMARRDFIRVVKHATAQSRRPLN
jgi:leucyl/phenylalanyl-tRNA--protein transferase